MNLLETAGFSCANPYYVVQQGKVRGIASVVLNASEHVVEHSMQVVSQVVSLQYKKLARLRLWPI